MDTLTAVLDGHRARGAHVLRVEMAGPWAIAVEDDAAVGLLVMLRGEAVLCREGHEPVALRPGDVAITTSGLRYVFADRPETEPAIVIGPGEVGRDLVGNDLCIALSHGVRRWGNAPGGEDMFITGTYGLPSQVTGRLLDAVPDLVVVRADEWDGAIVSLLGAEVDRDQPGQDVVIDRLVDLLLVATLREWFARPDSHAPAWWQAQGDAVVGPALALMHDNPSHPWTLASLAGRVAVSRATLARRFTNMVGQSPMAYLADWRIALAAELLRGSDATIEQVSRQVGYLSPFAFTAAFKKTHGVPPRTFRIQASA